jgi:hypothetical protein
MPGWHIRNASCWSVTTRGVRTLNESVDFHNLYHYGRGIRIGRPWSVESVVLAWLRLDRCVPLPADRFSN